MTFPLFIILKGQKSLITRKTISLNNYIIRKKYAFQKMEERGKILCCNEKSTFMNCTKCPLKRYFDTKDIEIKRNLLDIINRIMLAEEIKTKNDESQSDKSNESDVKSSQSSNYLENNRT